MILVSSPVQSFEIWSSTGLSLDNNDSISNRVNQREKPSLKNQENTNKSEQRFHILFPRVKVKWHDG